MKKLFFILLLSLFTLGLNASESGYNSQDVVGLCSSEEELKVGDYVVRPDPCPRCQNYGWIVTVVFNDGRCEFVCSDCGQIDIG